jgi:hypothetical protein
MFLIIFSLMIFGEEIHADITDGYDTVQVKERDYHNNMRFEIGIRDEIFISLGKVKNPSPGPINFHLTIGINFLKYYKIGLKAGIKIVSSDFEGIDQEIFFTADILKSNIYGIIGLDFFNMMGQLSHGVYYSSHGSFQFLCLGFGYHATKHFDLELVFYIPRSRVVVFPDLFSSQATAPAEQINRGLINFGFQYLFIF